MRVVGTVRVADVPVRLADHALSRYVERVKPALTTTQAIEDLGHVFACASFRHEPGWSHLPPDGAQSIVDVYDTWLVLGDDVAFALIPSRLGGWLAVTCITRTGISDKAREKRRRIGRTVHREPSKEDRPRGAWRNEIKEDLAA